MEEIELGQSAKCKITGFEGIIIARSIWLTGCDQYCIKPKVDKEGKANEGLWVDEGAVVIIGPGINSEEVKSKKPGGPQIDAPKV
tara:strand:+ start:1001 stop:1255 length:255 start_codon:yes stop_codon:yes gene_type:complete